MILVNVAVCSRRSSVASASPSTFRVTSSVPSASASPLLLAELMHVVSPRTVARICPNCCHFLRAAGMVRARAREPSRTGASRLLFISSWHRTPALIAAPERRHWQWCAVLGLVETFFTCSVFPPRHCRLEQFVFALSFDQNWFPISYMESYIYIHALSNTRHEPTPHT
jgi:hypothetical protein